MDIRLIGVNHYDPYGRLRIQNYLKGFRVFCPDCLATEWDHDIFQKIRSQRDYLYYKLLKENYTESQSEARLLADSMGFEADSHLSLYPHLNMIWLDEGRKASADDLDNYAENRYNLLKNYRCEKDNHFDIVETRRRLLSVGIHNAERSARDDIFTSHVVDAIEQGYKNIICIVGLAHASTKTEGGLASQLRTKGFPISVFDTTV